jgi:paired amphipathic helix protein Sin3a
MCYEVGAQYAGERHASLLANPVAVALGLDDPNGPASVLHQTMDALGKPASEDTNLVYIYLLSACEKLFDNELDQSTFEEHMRWFFGAKVGSIIVRVTNFLTINRHIHSSPWIRQ